jgi:diguanylate cyclase
MPAPSSVRPVAKAARTILAALAGRPQVLAFLPAITLAAYWFGGEAYLLGAAIAVPALVAVAGRFATTHATGGIDPDPWDTMPGRSAAKERISALLAQADKSLGTVAVLAVALDDPHDVEKRLGAPGFRDIVSRIGDRLAGAVRSTDLVAQLDESTFAVIVATPSRDSLETLLTLCARLQSAVAAPFSLGAARIYVTASIGIARPDREVTSTPDTLIGGAESAAREAAAHGPGSVRASTATRTTPARAFSPLAEEIAEALAQGHILPWYQPQVRADTGALSGAESLARWCHPQRGLIPPSEFLAHVDAAGLSERLGATMLHRSLAALRGMDQTNLRVPRISVNFSCAELRNPGLVEKVRWELDRFDLGPDRLIVEVLETVIDSTDDDIVTRNLDGLSRLGCGIDLDDFGTGYAAIGSIRRFSVQRVKIDRSFVTRLDTDVEQQAVVSAMIMMSDRLGLDTLAEGVETAAEHAALVRLGCRHVQGFAIARPMPEAAFRTWVASRSAASPDTRRRAEDATGAGDPMCAGKTA